MQAFANVATAPVRRETQGGGKIYWEFRAAESAKNEDKDGTTWYTVRIFQSEDPGFSKGDFIRIVGKLKLDVFMSREGKPMGVLVVMCFEAKRYEKPKSKGPSLELTIQSGPSQTDGIRAPRGASKVKVTLDKGGIAPALEEEIDEGWLALVS